MPESQHHANWVARVLRHLDAARATVSAIELSPESPVVMMQRLLSDIKAFVTELAAAPPNSDGSPAIDRPLSASGTTALCVCQLRKCLPLLAQAARTDHVTESLAYVCGRMRHCLAELGAHVTAPPPPADAPPPPPPGSRFVRAMDAAMDAAWALAECSDPVSLGSTMAALRTKEALEHAMTVAQVARPEDLRDISHAARKILAALAALEDECGLGADAGVCRLLASALGDALAAMEQQVNNAVLRLFLLVFSSPGKELRLLVGAALKAAEPDVLEPLVDDLDLATDRIMQVGLFAVACSGDSKRRLATRSCLASLESLEPELVPATTALPSDPASPRSRHLVLLATHWLAEIHELRLLVDGILDSAAFCQVATEEAASHAARAKRALSDSNTITKVSDEVGVKVSRAADGVIQCGAAVLRHLDAALPSLGNEAAAAAQKVREACAECKACLRLAVESAGEADETGRCPWARVSKRCQLLVTSLRRLQPPLHRLMDDSTTAELAPVEQSVHTWTPAKGNQDPLTPFVTAGRTLVKERGVLYTPQSTAAQTPLTTAARNTGGLVRGAAPTPQKLTSRWATRRLFHSSAAEDASLGLDVTGAKLPVTRDDSLGLDITGVLDQLTLLSGTLTSFFDASDSQAPPLLPASPCQLLSHCDPTACATDDDTSCKIATWERLEDLSKLKHRLDELRQGNAAMP